MVTRALRTAATQGGAVVLGPEAIAGESPVALGEETQSELCRELSTKRFRYLPDL